MACNSGCFNDDTITPTPIPKDGTTTVRRICFKCKATDALDSNNTDNCNVEAITNFCFDCFRANLYGKFKQAVTAHDMISPTDNVLVAFSGGPASRVALQFVHEMQSKAQRNLDASRDKLYPVFGVGVAFVDESAVRFNPSHEEENTLQDMRLIMSTLAPPTKELHITPIESIVSSESNDGRNKLKELLDIIVDVTGREDFLQHLRMLSLQKISIDKGYTKLVVGSCTSRVACHVISATVKGQGYSLPADIQHVDARWEIPVVLPLRDCLMQELAMLCRLDSLKTLDVSNGPHPGINGLVSSFISILQVRMLSFFYCSVPSQVPATQHMLPKTSVV
ncbi:hypothetical protein GIB67_012499 [Kingdonia uniflora]|uniref:Cytoplasmic tRNA 2-thiolation protein 2 n=1 Tax=Kingdonia uniflora TaxID=39325 RepID=A0A7J7MVG3_9MAGN|nr:hypothetical protein GIB67_012499 [Kingdonia uniflora]